MRRGFFAYAWDLLDEGPRGTVRRMAEEYACTALALHGLYHHARALRPRVRGPKTVHPPGALAAFHPRGEYYQDSGLIPAVDQELADAAVINRSREACEEYGLDFALWVVGLHNSTLGEAHSRRCVENCFGDVYTYSLCPSQPDNQRYLAGLVRDVSEQFAPDRLLFEAVGPLGLRHGLHHELFLTAWDESLELLFSLCFCPACRERAQSRGIPVVKFQERVRELTRQLLNQERGALPASFRSLEPAALLMEVEYLAEYLRMGQEAVGDLVGSLREIARGAGGILEVIPSSFQRPTSRSWLERGSLSMLAQKSDGLMISAYFDPPQQVRADLAWVQTLAPEAGISAGLNAGEPTSSPDNLRAAARACREAGCRGVYFYNYGLLTDRRLNWVREINSWLEAEEDGG